MRNVECRSIIEGRPSSFALRRGARDSQSEPKVSAGFERKGPDQKEQVALLMVPHPASDSPSLRRSGTRRATYAVVGNR